MAKSLPSYVVDSNVLIAAYRQYYAFDVFPGFWQSLQHYHHAGRIISITNVRDEILKGNEDQLGSWVRGIWAKEFFVEPSQEEVIQCFQELQNWVRSAEQFKPQAKAEFSRVADGWVIAYAKSIGAAVITHEKYQPEVKRTVPMPNICKAFNVPYLNTFEMLAQLRAQYHWRTSA